MWWSGLWCVVCGGGLVNGVLNFMKFMKSNNNTLGALGPQHAVNYIVVGALDPNKVVNNIVVGVLGHKLL